MTSTRPYIFRFSYLFKKQRRKQNAEGTGNQSRQKVNRLILLQQYVKGFESFHAGRDVRPAIPFACMGDKQLRGKTQWKINQPNEVFSENPGKI